MDGSFDGYIHQMNEGTEKEYLNVAISRLMSRMLVTSRKMTSKMTTSQLWLVSLHGSFPSLINVRLSVQSLSQYLPA